MAIDILSLPPEVIHSILNKVAPTDLARLKRCCRWFNDFIRSDWLIAKEIFLDRFDDPRTEQAKPGDKQEPDWEADLHKFVRAGKILESKDIALKQAELLYVAETIERLVKTGPVASRPSRNLEFLLEHFNEQNEQNKDIFICSSSLFKWAEGDLWKERPSSSLAEENAAHEGDIADREDVAREVDVPREGGANDSSPVIVGSLDSSVRAIHDRAAKQKVMKPLEVTSADAQKQRLSAKIHCLYGVPIQEVRRGVKDTSGKRYPLRSDTAPLHPYVRSRVYDLRQHTKNNNASFWGPLLSDGTQEVDWEKMESIMLMLHHNMSHFARTHDLFAEDAIPNWTLPFNGATPYSYRSRQMDVPMNPSIPLEARDPYNVSGTWMRVVCFLDYTELYGFNFGPDSLVPANAPRPPLNTEEATRLITMRIQITKITPPGEDEGQELPVVHFKGTSSSVRPSWDVNANSEIKEQGTVKLTPQGEVRWTTWSIFHGEERWRSEGIQVGGVQSGRGVLGFWFDKDYDIHGPAGPTAFWKSHDGIEKKRPQGRLLDGGLHALHVPLY